MSTLWTSKSINSKSGLIETFGSSGSLKDTSKVSNSLGGHKVSSFKSSTATFHVSKV